MSLSEPSEAVHLTASGRRAKQRPADLQRPLPTRPAPCPRWGGLREGLPGWRSRHPRAREPARFERAPAQPRPARGQDHSRSGPKHRPIARARPPPDPSRQRCARAGRDVGRPVAPALCCRRRVNEPRPRRASRSDDQEAVEARDRRPLRAGRQDLLERDALLGAGPRTTRPPPNTPFEPRPKRPPAPSRRASAASQRAQRAARDPMLQHVQLPPRPPPRRGPPRASRSAGRREAGGVFCVRTAPSPPRPPLAARARRRRALRWAGAPAPGLSTRSCWLLHASSGGRRLGAPSAPAACARAGV
jgi:hypothetical protein